MAVTEGIPGRYRLRVKQRLAVVESVKQHGIKPALTANRLRHSKQRRQTPGRIMASRISTLAHPTEVASIERH